MARLPTPADISPPGSIRPTSRPSVADTSAIGRGVQELGRGIESLGAAGENISQQAFAAQRRERDAQDAMDFTRAQAEWVRGTLEMENRFNEDGDWQTFDERAQAESMALLERSAGMIRNPEAREQWQAQTELRRLTLVDGIGDRGRTLERQENIANFEGALRTSAGLMADPSVTEEVRSAIREDMVAAITIAKSEGVLTPAEAEELSRVYVDGAEQQLALNRAALDLDSNPNGLIAGLGISPSAGPNDLAQAAALAGNGVVALDISVARDAARALGDNAFPDDDGLAEAYLTDPEANQQIAAMAMDMMVERYDGDVTAAVIATAPGGGRELADQWVQSGHDEGVLPTGVRNYYQRVMERMSPQRESMRIPVQAADGVDISRVDVATVDLFEQAQSIFGQPLTVISGYRDPSHNAAIGGAPRSQHLETRALDIDVSHLSEEDRLRFIQTASALGFGGIGVYENTIHLDTGSRRAWGPSHSADSVPAWARETIDRHTRGEISTIVPGLAHVAEEYRALSFDQRLQLYTQAKQERDRQNLDTRAGIQISVANAPAAIMRSGSFEGFMPTANDFVAAYGAADGIERFKAFDAAIDVAEAAFDFRTMSASDIAATVESYMPSSNGQNAAIEQERFNTVQQAATEILKARADDPAGYVMSAYPSVASAWENMGDDWSSIPAYLDMMETAQSQLGMEGSDLLPDAFAQQVAATFNNTELTQPERVGALAQLFANIPSESQQQAVWSQLVDNDVDEMATGAMRAMMRGDAGAANRLFRAAMSDPNDMPGAMPASITTTILDEKARDLMFAPGGIGDVYFGLHMGTAENLAQAANDGKLLARAAELAIRTGEASNADEAVRLAMRDLFGDVKLMNTTRNVGGSWAQSIGNTFPLAGLLGGLMLDQGEQVSVRAVLPSDVDEGQVLRGLGESVGLVRDALFAEFSQDMPPAGPDLELAVRTREYWMEEVMREGYFERSGDGDFHFFEPFNGSWVVDSTGAPLSFTLDEILTLGQSQ